MYAYYRATSKAEADSLINNFSLNKEAGVTYWTDGLAPARLYQGASRVIVKVLTDKPIPECYQKVALQADAGVNVWNHNEWCVPKSTFNKFIAKFAESIEIVG